MLQNEVIAKEEQISALEQAVQAHKDEVMKLKKEIDSVKNYIYEAETKLRAKDQDMEIQVQRLRDAETQHAEETTKLQEEFQQKETYLKDLQKENIAVLEKKMLEENDQQIVGLFYETNFLGQCQEADSESADSRD
jgi:predicted RNase H-like nuclease (RuvC/YqgF family)